MAQKTFKGASSTGQATQFQSVLTRHEDVVEQDQLVQA